jgi:hypothetical protein
VPVLGLFLLAVAYGINHLKKKPLILAACILILGLSVPQIVDIKTERYNGPMKEVVEYMKDNMKPDDVFIHTDEHTFGTFCYYFPEHKSYLYLQPGFIGYSGYSAYAPVGSCGSDIESFIKGKKNIWLVDRVWSQFNGILNGSGSINITGTQQSFQLPKSWFAFSVTRVEPAN